MSPRPASTEAGDTVLEVLIDSIKGLREDVQRQHELAERTHAALTSHVSSEALWQQSVDGRLDVLAKRVDEYQPIVTEARDDRVRRAGIAKAAAALAAIVGATWAAGDSVVKFVEALMPRRP